MTPFGTLKDKVLVFLQMTRTAGLSICSILQEEVGTNNFYKFGGTFPGESNSYEDFKEAAADDVYSVYGGHFFYGAHRHIPRPCEYITSLRNPVEQLLSRYEATCRNKNKKFDCGEWLASDFESHNGMVKRLCGIGIMDDETPPFDFMNDKPTPLDMKVGEQEFQLALRNIENHFSCVLLFERFEENMVVLQRHYRTSPLFSFNRQYLNHAMTPIRRENYPQEVIEQIIAQNAYDIRLYEMFAKKYLQELSAQGEDFFEDVRIMKLIAGILSHPGAQIISTDMAVKRLNAALYVFLKNGKTSDSIQVLKRFSHKTHALAEIRQFAVGFMNSHGTLEDLKEEMENYKRKYGADEFLAPYLEQLDLRT